MSNAFTLETYQNITKIDVKASFNKNLPRCTDVVEVFETRLTGEPVNYIKKYHVADGEVMMLRYECNTHMFFTLDEVLTFIKNTFSD